MSEGPHEAAVAAVTREAAAPTALTPTVSIVGRPNVGKSTLFNRIVGRRQAIVHDMPGVTRDRLSAFVELDRGSVEARGVELIDTGGLVPGDDPLGLNKQVMVAVEESDLLLFVVDGRAGLTTADERVWHELRPVGKPTVLVVNKGDTRDAKERFAEFYSLGLEEMVLVSAEHGIGTGDLLEAALRSLPPAEAPPPAPAEGVPAVAIVGRPNVGKSSLLNKIVGSERTLVSPTPGTTRDPIDTPISFDDKDYVLIDTAGIRRRAKTADQPEELAVMMARRQIERASLAVLVVDAAQGVTTGDLAIAGTVWELGRAAVVAINKWDLLDEDLREELERSWERLDQLLAGPERVNVSALTGRAVEKLFPAIDRTLVSYNTELTTGEVNRFFEQALIRNKPPHDKGRSWKVYYATQVGTAPPTFMLFANRTLPRSHTYRRYLENRLRAELALPGVPIRLVIRKRGKEKAEKER